MDDAELASKLDRAIELAGHIADMEEEMAALLAEVRQEQRRRREAAASNVRELRPRDE